MPKLRDFVYRMAAAECSKPAGDPGIASFLAIFPWICDDVLDPAGAARSWLR